jgi:hypothetical protein
MPSIILTVRPLCAGKSRQAIPVFFVEDAHDLLAPPELARRYYESIRAPEKGWVLLEHSWHDPNQEVVDAEYKVLRERVLPLTRHNESVSR